MLVAQPVVCIFGPTASGKTQIAHQLFKQLPSAEIFSIDAGAIYQNIQIGNTKPTAAEQKQFHYHMLNLCAPQENYSVSAFLNALKTPLQQCIQKGKTPILVGGTMMYFNALFNGLSSIPKSDPIIRQEIETQLQKNGRDALHKKLQKIDSPAAQKIHPNDTQRLIRALTVFTQTGQALSHFQNHKQHILKNLQFFNILVQEEKTQLHQHIKERFQHMLTSGLIEEVKYIRAQYHSPIAAMKLVSYKEVWEYINGRIDYCAMQTQAITATCQLAKRQQTWIKKIHSDLTILPKQNPIDSILQALEKNKSFHTPHENTP